MRWGFAAGQILLEDEPDPMIRKAAGSFDHWEVTGEGPLGRRDGLSSIVAIVDDLDLSLTYHAAFRDVDLAHPDDDERAACRDRLADQIRWAADLGVEAVVVHPGRDRGSDPIARSRDSLEALADCAHEEEIELRVENMPATRDELGQHPADLAEIADGIVDGICLDVGHLHTLPGSPDLTPIADCIAQLHLHANDGFGDDHDPVTGDATWMTPTLERFVDRDVLAVFEHRYVEECVASLRSCRRLLDGHLTG